MEPIIWTPQPGPQTAIIRCTADEILAGGARGGGKTLGGILWLMKGNPDLDEDNVIHRTALEYPRYTALVVRRHRQDLREWVEQANEIFAPMGGVIGGNPPVFKWASGAKIYVDHLNDAESFSKYRGWNLHRILVEELTEIPQKSWYLKLLGSLRSKRGHDMLSLISPQILSTTNPDGPGSNWVKSRFVEIYTEGGRAMQWNGVSDFAYTDIPAGRVPPTTYIADPVSKLVRCFIPALLDDNKFLGEEYERMLLAQKGESEALYLAWRYGRWDVFSGQFFDNLRWEGPMPGDEAREFPNACHTYDKDKVALAPWWPTTIGVDWGYNHEAAAYWGKHNPHDKRLYVYREKVVRNVGSYDLGRMVAQETLPDIQGLEDEPHIPLYLSHDAFSKEDDTKTRAALFAEGVNDVIGKDSAHLVELTDKEQKMSAAEAFDSSTARYNQLSEFACITIHRARQDRAAMASYVREMLNWRTPPKVFPDMNYAAKLLATMDGHELYEEYMARFRNQKDLIMPRVLIEKSLKRIQQCMTSLVHDPDNTEVPLKVNATPGADGDPGDDPYDGLCHLLMGARYMENRKPRHVFVGERLERFRAHFGNNPDPAVFHQVLQKAHEDFVRKGRGFEGMDFDDRRLM